MTGQPLHYDQAMKTLRANLSPRYRRLHTLETFADGTQYEGVGLADWFNDDVPMRERAPCIVDPIVGRAIGSYGDLMFGEDRWPEITSKPAEGDEHFLDQLRLSEDASQSLDHGIRHIADQSKIKSAAAAALAEAQSACSVATICGVRNGLLSLEMQKAKWSTPEFDPVDPEKVIRLEIRYPYVEEYLEHNKPAVRTMLYRRVIDTEKDTTFKPVPADENGGEPDSWVPDPLKTFEHDYGFCPVVWYPHQKKISATQSFDGRALHQSSTKEIEALDRSLSQHHRASQYCGDPQIVETGVDENHNPTTPGRAAVSMASYRDESPEAKASHRQWHQTPPGGGTNANQGRRRKGVGVVWRYPEEKTKVFMLALPAGALDAINDDTASNKSLIAQAMSYVDLDAEAAKRTGRRSGGGLSTELSGRAIERLYKPQTNACDKLRVDFGNKWLLPVINCLLRVALRHAPSKGDAITQGALYLPGLAQLLPVAAKFEIDVQAPTVAEPDATVKTWFAPKITLKWGDYFEVPDEEATKVNAAVRDDFAAGLIKRETAVEKLSEFYGIEDAKAYAEELQKEKDEHEAKEADALAKANEKMNGAEPMNGMPPAKQPIPNALS